MLNAQTTLAAIAVSVLSLATITTTATAQARRSTSAGSITAFDEGARISLGQVALEITLVADDAVRIRLAPPEEIDLPRHSYAVLPDAAVPRKADVRTTKRGATSTVVIAGPQVTARVTVAPNRQPTIAILDSKGRTAVESAPENAFSWDLATGATRVAHVRPRDELYYGFGEKALSLSRVSYQIVNWNTDTPGYQRGTDPIYQTVPYTIALRNGLAYGLFFDNTYRSFFDVGSRDSDRLVFGAAGGWADYYVFTGGADRDARRVIERYTEFTGRSELPPLWSLGYQQCRWSYSPEARVREIASTFRRLQIPCDVIYLDIDYMDGYRVFTWDRTRFPDPKRLVSDLRADGFRTVVIIDPGIKVDDSYAVYRSGQQVGAFHKNADGSEFQGRVWPGVCAFPDFTSPGARAWWGEQFSDLVDTGIAGFWTDMNEPSTFLPDDLAEPRYQHHPLKTFPLDVRHEGDGRPGPHSKYHNVYGQQMARATREGVLQLAPHRRPFVLTRASYAGGQRYSASWTGDNLATWDHLKLSIPMLLNMGLSGQSLVGADIGGFIDSPTPELYTRWLQAAALTPVMRSHTVINSPDQEPWSFGDAYTQINRQAIELRYRLLPYLYAQFHESESTGIPVMRPLWLDYQQDLRTYEIDDQFLVGSDLLIAPVVHPEARERRVYLPKGATWIDWYTGEAHDGGRDITVSAPLDRLPIFVRAGATIPMRPVAQSTDAQRTLPLTIRVFAGTGASSTIYDDSGDGYGYRNGEFARFTVSAERTPDGSVTVTLGARDGTYQSPADRLEVELVGGGAGTRAISRASAADGIGSLREIVDLTGPKRFAIAIPNDGQRRSIRFDP